MALLEVIGPLTLVLGAIHMGVGTEPMSLVFVPFAIKDVTISVPKDTTTMRLSV